jgi:hypothetical protein
MCAKNFGSDGMLRITGKPVKSCSVFGGGGRPSKSMFVAAGFLFAPSELIREVPYDVSLKNLFFGEEVSLVRSGRACACVCMACDVVACAHEWWSSFV